MSDRPPDLYRSPADAVEFRTEAKVIARAGRDAEKYAGVVAIRTVVDTDTGEVVEEPKVLTVFGEVGREFREDA